MHGFPGVAIIGAGPAGSATALYLVRRGIAPEDITLIDRASFPRQKLCGGGIPWRSLRLVRELVGRPPNGWQTDGLLINIGDTSLLAREPGPQWLYDRAYLDNVLLNECRALGVNIRESTKVTALERVGSAWRVGWPDGEKTFSWIIGADGACGITARTTGLGGTRMGRLMEGVYEATTDKFDGSKLVMDFDPLLDGIPGYAWIFPYPRGDGTVAWKLGIMDGGGCVSGRVLRQWTNDYARRHGFRETTAVHGWPERYFDRRARAQIPGLVVTGEAWGIDPLLGEGIGPALHMAKYTAMRVARAIKGEQTCIRGYEAGFIATREGQNLVFQGAIADAVYTQSGDSWIRAALQAPGLAALTSQGCFTFGRLFPLFSPLLAYGAAAKRLRPGNKQLPTRDARRNALHG